MILTASGKIYRCVLRSANGVIALRNKFMKRNELKIWTELEQAIKGEKIVYHKHHDSE